MVFHFKFGCELVHKKDVVKLFDNEKPVMSPSWIAAATVGLIASLIAGSTAASEESDGSLL